MRDGKVYGRGACDMKGGLAAAVVAVESLIESGIAWPGAIEISGTVDEESGGYGGVAYLAERGWFSSPRVDHVIIPEPLECRPGLHRPSRRVVGGDRDLGPRSRMARCRSWATAPSGT